MADFDIEPEFIARGREKAKSRKSSRASAREPVRESVREPVREPVRADDEKSFQRGSPDDSNKPQKRSFFSMFKENKILLITTAIVIILLIVFIIWTMRKDSKPKGPPPPDMMHLNGMDRDNIPQGAMDMEPDHEIPAHPRPIPRDAPTPEGPTAQADQAVPAAPSPGQSRPQPAVNNNHDPNALHNHIMRNVDDDELQKYINMNDGSDGDASGASEASEGSEGSDDPDDLGSLGSLDDE